jgi:hypothetical protein
VTTQTALAAAAALVALAFALCTFERWLDRRRRHELAWAISLVMFSAGSTALWYGAAAGWGALSFRLFYLFGAVLNVPFLALGTVYLLGGPRAGDRWAAVVGLGSAFAVGVVLVAPLRRPVPGHRLPQGSDVFGALPRVLAALASGAGATVVLVGAGWSTWRLLARVPATNSAGSPLRPGRPTARLAGGNVLIAAGTLVLGAGGLFNSVLDEMEAFAVTLLVGIALLFAGFLVATGGQTALRAAPAPAGHRPGPGTQSEESHAVGH